jgi:hypothetical protein
MLIVGTLRPCCHQIRAGKPSRFGHSSGDKFTVTHFVKHCVAAFEVFSDVVEEHVDCWAAAPGRPIPVGCFKDNVDSLGEAATRPKQRLEGLVDVVKHPLMVLGFVVLVPRNRTAVGAECASRSGICRAPVMCRSRSTDPFSRW